MHQPPEAAYPATFFLGVELPFHSQVFQLQAGLICIKGAGDQENLLDSYTDQLQLHLATGLNGGHGHTNEMSPVQMEIQIDPRSPRGPSQCPKQFLSERQTAVVATL